jgi:hypothetical protein
VEGRIKCPGTTVRFAFDEIVIFLRRLICRMVAGASDILPVNILERLLYFSC